MIHIEQMVVEQEGHKDEDYVIVREDRTDRSVMDFCHIHSNKAHGSRYAQICFLFICVK